MITLCISLQRKPKSCSLQVFTQKLQSWLPKLGVSVSACLSDKIRLPKLKAHCLQKNCCCYRLQQTAKRGRNTLNITKVPRKFLQRRCIVTQSQSHHTALCLIVEGIHVPLCSQNCISHYLLDSEHVGLRECKIWSLPSPAMRVSCTRSEALYPNPTTKLLSRLPIRYQNHDIKLNQLRLFKHHWPKKWSY